MQKLKIKIDQLLSEHPFILKKEIKEKKILEILRLQIKHHIKKCKDYRKWYIKSNFIDPGKIKKFQDVPYIPSKVFKKIHLKSNMKNNKIISSSGSSNSSKSSIFLDSTTSSFQKKSLSKILSNIYANKRQKFFIVDLEPTENFQQDIISARYAGMSGYLLAAKSKIYLLEKKSNNKILLNKKKLLLLKNIIKSEPVTIIGYTYMLWEYLMNNSDNNLNKIKTHPETKIIHFGGWKKLENKKVTKETFISKIKECFNIKINSILDIFGFSEQLGSIYISKGKEGCDINSYSHILIRDPKTLEVVKDGQKGFMQFLSILPTSYPGFSILNDDIGYISKRKIINKTEYIQFKVNTRLDKLEARGCGDTLPENYYI